MVAGDIHLVNLAQRQVAAHIGQSAQDAAIAGGHAAAKRASDKKVTDQHRHMVAPHVVDCRQATALGGLIDHVIMD